MTPPAPLVAAYWREWLHPRGKDGQFIQKLGAMLDIFQNPDSRVSDPRAVKRRAKLVSLSPEGARVEYRNARGQVIPAEPDAGFPEVIAGDDFTSKVSIAPPVRARIPVTQRMTSDTTEDAAQTLQTTPQMKAWQASLDEVNVSVLLDPPVGRSANVPGGGAITRPRAKDLRVEGETVAEMFASVRSQLDPLFQDHMTYVQEMVSRTESSSIERFFRDSDGMWTPEIDAYVDAVVAAELAEYETRGVGKNRRAIMLGGLPGAGKGRALERIGVQRGEWAISDPDDMKKRLIQDGLIPTVAGLAPMELAGLVHELSAEMTGRLENDAQYEGYNIVLDSTMGGHGSGPKSAPELNREGLSENGYEDVDAVFVSVDTATSVKGQVLRYMDGFNRLRTEESDLGGRYVPEYVLEASVSGGNEPRSAVNFTKMRRGGAFKRWLVVEGSNYNIKNTLIGKGTEAGRPPKVDTFGRLLEPVANIPGRYED